MYNIAESYKKEGNPESRFCRETRRLWTYV